MFILKFLNEDKKKALHYNFYFIPALILAVIGVLNTSFLTYSHYQNYTNPIYSSFCAISRTVNCDTVSQSPWSIFMGFPTALWGLLGYLVFLCLVIASKRKNTNTINLWSILLLLGITYSSIALFLGYISAVKIKSYCILCIISYLNSFLLFFYSWIIWRRFGHVHYLGSLKAAISLIFSNRSIKICLTVLLLSFIILKAFLPQYWHLQPTSQNSLTSSGITIDGHPWIGSEDAIIIIEEFSDYQCFQCYKMHFSVRNLIEKYPHSIKLIHRQYPLDHKFNPVVGPVPFHEGSGELALMAIAAAKQNKFWEMNDRIFEEVRNKQSFFNVQSLAENVGVDAESLQKDIYSKSSLKKLEQDIRDGLRHKIISTPTFIIDGKIYEGSIPPDILSPLL